jgi:multiple sugar transport system substrate-binding protein
MVTRRSFLKGTAAAGTLAATSFPVPTPIVAQPREVRWLNNEPDPNTVRFLNETAAEYERKTGVKVIMEHVPVAEAYPKTIASIKAGRAYDIVTVGEVTMAVLLAGEGHCVPVTDIVKKVGLSDFGPKSLWWFKNELYMYPYDYNFCYLFYRSDWYRERGIKPATTLGEFAEIVKAFTAGDRFGWAHPLSTHATTNWAGVNVLWAHGVRLFGEGWNVILDSPEIKPRAVAALNYLKATSPYMPKGMPQAQYADLINAFVAENVAHTFYTGRLIHHLEKVNPKIAENYGIMGFPTASPDRWAVTHATDGWVVIKEGRATLEALKLLEWFVTERLVDYVKTLVLHYQPVQHSIYRHPRWQSDPLVQKHRHAVDAMYAFLDEKKTVINAIDIDGPGLDVIQGKVWNAMIIPEMYQEVLLRGLDPARAVDNAAAKIRKLQGRA